MSGTELFASAKAVHDRAENESAEDVTLPIEHSEKRTPTIAGRISHLIETLHELITQGDYDEALRTLTEVRGLLARQIELKEHRSEQVIDERMADFELKALALDLEILKARE